MLEEVFYSPKTLRAHSWFLFRHTYLFCGVKIIVPVFLFLQLPMSVIYHRNLKPKIFTDIKSSTLHENPQF